MIEQSVGAKDAKDRNGRGEATPASSAPSALKLASSLHVEELAVAKDAIAGDGTAFAGGELEMDDDPVALMLDILGGDEGVAMGGAGEEPRGELVAALRHQGVLA